MREGACWSQPWRTLESQVAACSRHELFTPASCSGSVRKRNIHLQAMPHQAQTALALGFIGQGCIAGGQCHQFNQLQSADIEGSLILKSTGFKTAPVQLSVLQPGTTAAIEFGQFRPFGPGAEQGLATTFQPAQ